MKKLICSLVLVCMLALSLTSCAQLHYFAALKFIEEGKYEEAYILLKNLEEYEDSERLLSCFYYVPTSFNDSGTVYEISYGSKNFPVMLTVKSPSGAISRTEYFYDSLCNLTRIVWTEEDGRSDTYDRTYDENGNIIKELFSFSDGSCVSYEFTFDELKNKIREICTYSDGNVVTVDYFYNESSVLTKAVSFYNGTESLSYHYAYDSKGNLIKEETHDPHLSAADVHELLYDDQGNLTKETFLHDGRLSSYEYEYEKNGRLTKKTETDYKAEKTVHDYTYDDNGNLSKCVSTHSSGTQTTVLFDYKLVYIKSQLPEPLVDILNMYY